ncbi:MAG: hypothetical protein ACK5LX_09895 [Oscillospiraceae bacterium]
MKKVLSLVLAVVLVLGVASVAFGGPAVTKSNIVLGRSVTGGLVDSGDYYMPNDVRPGDDGIIFYIFTEDGSGNLTHVVKGDTDAKKLGAQVRATEGGSVINRDVSVKYESAAKGGFAYVEFTFVDEFVSTKDQDFSAKLYLTFDKSRVAETEIEISGTFGNEVENVDEYDDYVYLGDTHVVEADAYIRSIQVDLGQNVSIWTRMFEGKKYYGAVSQEVKAEDEAVLAKYPDIDTVYYLKTINLNATGDTVAFDMDTNMYVYVQDADGNLVFLGRSADKLPYYTKYFLSAKELDVEAVTTEPGDTTEPGESPEEPPITGGDDAPAENVNDNPGTGR